VIRRIGENTEAIGVGGGSGSNGTKISTSEEYGTDLTKLAEEGKTTVVEGLAQRIAFGDVPETIEGKKVITLDMGLLVAGTKYRGEFEERLKKLMEEIKQADDIILVIDEVHIADSGKLPI
jgi:ATP-dependent Clp protease ATP-binding subunit ClpC